MNPIRRQYYTHHEMAMILNDFHVTYVTDDANYIREFSAQPDFQILRSRAIARTFAIDYGKLAYFEGMHKVLKEKKPNVIINYEIFTFLSFQTELAKDKYNFKHVITCDETVSASIATWGKFIPTRFFAKVVGHKADLFIAHTKKAANALVNSGVDKQRIVQIYPGIFPIDFNKYRLNSFSNYFKITYIGAIRENKGVKTLLKAFSHPDLTSIPNLQLIIAGSGPLHHVVEEYSKNDNRIVYEGRVSDERKKQLLASSDIFVYPSEDINLFGTVRWEEQTAISVMEAMMAGLPVIGTDSGSLPEIVGCNELVIPQRSPDKLAAKIVELYKDKRKREEISKYNLKRSREIFDIGVYANKVNECLTELLA